MEVNYEITPDFRVPEDKKHLLEGERSLISSSWDDCEFSVSECIWEVNERARLEVGKQLYRESDLKRIFQECLSRLDLDQSIEGD